jgi:hypothetical protein
LPNLFAEQTTISYNVPAKIVKAQIIFYNFTGQIIQTVELKTRELVKLKKKSCFTFSVDPN